MLEQKLFKWVGGKKWLKEELEEKITEQLINKDANIYIEPFAGGLGSVFCALPLLEKHGIEKIIVNDINKALIKTYKSIKTKKNKVFKDYWALEMEFKKTIPQKAYKLDPKKDKEELKKLLKDANDFFKEKKIIFNKVKETNNIEMVSLFLFLSQHSFNGLYRENQKGEYNTPFNWEAKIPEKKKKKMLIDKYSEIFNKYNIVFENMDVFRFLNKYKTVNDISLYYIDPPYANEKTKETAYNKGAFTLAHQKKLLNRMSLMNSVIFSNHSLDLFKCFCENNNFNYMEVYRKNIMTAKAENRSQKIAEILAWK